MHCRLFSTGDGIWHTCQPGVAARAPGAPAAAGPRRRPSPPALLPPAPARGSTRCPPPAGARRTAAASPPAAPPAGPAGPDPPSQPGPAGRRSRPGDWAGGRTGAPWKRGPQSGAAGTRPSAAAQGVTGQGPGSVETVLGHGLKAEVHFVPTKWLTGLAEAWLRGCPLVSQIYRLDRLAKCLAYALLCQAPAPLEAQAAATPAGGLPRLC